MRFERDVKVRRALLYLCMTFVLSYLSVSHAKSDQGGVQEAMIAVLCNHGYQESIGQWTPTAAYLAREIPDWSFTILPLTRQQYESAIDRGIVDFAISCPSLYVKLEVLYGATRMVTMKTHYANGVSYVFAGVFLCRSDRNDIRGFEELRGKRLRGLHGRDCTTWHLACSELLRHDLDPAEDFKEVRFSTSPNEIVQAILSNQADVGILRSDMYDSMKVGGEIHPDEIRVLHENDETHRDVPFDHSTAVFPERVFAKLRHTSDELTERVTVALLKMPSEGLAAEAARCSGWTIPHNYQPIHDVLKMLRISPYDQFGKVTLGTVFFQYKPWITSIFFLVAAIIACLGFTLVQTRRLNRAKRMILEQQIVETSDRTQQTLGGIIHDTLGQQLTAIRLLAETLREQSDEQGGKFTRSICSILDLAREATRNSRQITTNLYPVELSLQGLGSAVESYLSAMKSIFGIQYKFRFPENFTPANPEFSLHLYRIIQEAVHNAIKHGQAEHVQVVLEERAGSYVLYFEDDGIGFNPDEINHTGLGLHIMKYRANAIRGDLTIAGGWAGGTRVTFTFDLTKGVCRNDRVKPIIASG